MRGTARKWRVMGRNVSESGEERSDKKAKLRREKQMLETKMTGQAREWREEERKQKKHSTK
jgi:hypothetical protein